MGPLSRPHLVSRAEAVFAASLASLPQSTQAPVWEMGPLLLVKRPRNLCGSPRSQVKAHTPPLSLRALHNLASVYLSSCISASHRMCPGLLSRWTDPFTPGTCPSCFPVLVLVLTQHLWHLSHQRPRFCHILVQPRITCMVFAFCGLKRAPSAVFYFLFFSFNRPFA